MKTTDYIENKVDKFSKGYVFTSQLSETLKNETEPILLVKHHQNLLIWDCFEGIKIQINL